jgi:hypothetical protein
MLSFTPFARKPTGERGRQLRVDDASSYAQHRMITLTRRKFENGDDIPLFEKRVVLKNFRMRLAGRENIQDVLDPYAQRPDARATAALLWIDGDAVQFVHGVVSFSLRLRAIKAEFSGFRQFPRSGCIAAFSERAG